MESQVFVQLFSHCFAATLERQRKKNKAERETRHGSKEQTCCPTSRSIHGAETALNPIQSFVHFNIQNIKSAISKTTSTRRQHFLITVSMRIPDISHTPPERVGRSYHEGASDQRQQVPAHGEEDQHAVEVEDSCRGSGPGQARLKRSTVEECM